MYRPYQKIHRRKSKSIKVGNVEIGGNAPISVQTMTNTLTSKRLQEQELYAFSQHLVWLDFFCD